ncbi:transglycosylase domain-containing protein [Brevibacterium litoralis]|uniref:transglycosylase domain-containing protein n=1 Tax=Brevibacterium litoralis TaxID=3138935 RepID=UPI0032EE4BA4
MSVVAGIVAAGFAIPAVGAGSAAAQTGVDIFNSLPAELEERPLAEKSTMLAADDSVIAEFYWQNRREVPLEDISEHMRNATVAIEDARFYEHGGVDIQGIARAAVHNALADTTQGGSTLTQQYVKNVLAENAHAVGDEEGVEAAKEAEGTEGYARKLRELKLAVAVENKYSKDEILNRYMNINNYSGSPNVYGVEAAAYRYWGKSASELGIAESATLAGIVKNPSLYNPQDNEQGVINRRNVVLDLMLEQEYITAEEHEEATSKGLELDLQSTPNGCLASGNMAYFCDYVQRTIENDPIFGETEDERFNFLQRGGLTIKTTLDPTIQNIADKEIKDRIPVGDAGGAGHALTTIEPGTGKVIAMAQNRNYTVSTVEEGRKYYETQINYNVDKAHNGANGFQVGSTWKAFVLTQWLKEGHNINETVNASYREFSAGSWRYDGCTDHGDDWKPRNAGDSSTSSYMTAENATKQSVNTAYAAMANKLNMCGILETAMDIGVVGGTGMPLDTPDADGITAALSPAATLGTTDVAPIHMASAYATFASGGTYCKPTPIESITTNDGTDVEVPSADCHEALDPDVANAVAYTLGAGFNGGTTNGLYPGRPAGAKTGTTDFDVGHSWLVGFTKSLSTAVWTGSADGNKDWQTVTEGTVRGRVYGATFSGKTWSAYMSQAVEHTTGNLSFDRPGPEFWGGGGDKPPPPPRPTSDSSSSSSSDSSSSSNTSNGGGGNGGGGNGGGGGGNGGGGNDLGGGNAGFGGD